jgi:outer membrane protein
MMWRKKKYDAGVGSNLEVVTAQSALLESQTNYFVALYDAMVARIDYQKATGTLIK